MKPRPGDGCGLETRSSVTSVEQETRFELPQKGADEPGWGLRVRMPGVGDAEKAACFAYPLSRE